MKGKKAASKPANSEKEWQKTPFTNQWSVTFHWVNILHGCALLASSFARALKRTFF
jgi:hypothetical protein